MGTQTHLPLLLDSGQVAYKLFIVVFLYETFSVLMVWKELYSGQKRIFGSSTVAYVFLCMFMYYILCLVVVNIFLLYELLWTETEVSGQALFYKAFSYAYFVR